LNHAGTSIRILPAEQMVPEMKRRLKDTVDVLNIPQSAAAVLLREHKWSKDVLFEKFYNDPIKLEQKYGVFYRCNPVRAIQKANNVCEICYEEGQGQPMISMPCGHEFCKDCWRDFCDNAILEGPSCVRKSCPQAKCKEMMTEEEVEQAAPHLLHTFETYQLRSFIESNMLTRWCPGPGCERIAIASSTSALEQDAKVAKCDSCSTLFCLPCGEEPHAPCDCKEVALWNIKCKSESETANWILANTKPCPKCISRIEKNQGCNHMTCQKCKYEFCWICLGDWSNHGANT
jgi:ariadne-1